MRQTNNFILFLFLFTFFYSTASAQLAGGTYTVGPFGDYTTLNDAVNALSGGISGPVVFDVDASVVYDETFEISEITGSSAANTVTFQGNGAVIAVSTPADVTSSAFFPVNNSTIALSAVSHVTIDGFNIIPQVGSMTDGIRLGNGAHHNTIVGCTIDLSLTSPYVFGVGGIYSTAYWLGFVPFANGPPAVLQHNHILNNRIINSSNTSVTYGIFLAGVSNAAGSSENIIENNRIEGYFNAGITLFYGHDNTVVSGNTIKGRFGIGIDLQSANTAIVIEKNTIITDTTIAEGNYTSIKGFNKEYTPQYVAIPTQIKNNVFVLASKLVPVYGLSCHSNYTRIYNNTVYIQADGDADANGIFADNNYSSYSLHQVEFLNNIIYIDGQGQGVKYLINLFSYWFAIDYGVYDYNSYYFSTQTNNGFFGKTDGAQYATLADWQASPDVPFEQNGIYSDPVFTSLPNLDFTPNSAVLNNAGYDLVSTGRVTDDFNGQIRIPPLDPGALIFDAQNENATVLDLITPTSNTAPGNSNIEIEFQNIGNSLLTSAQIKWRINGGVVNSHPWLGNLAPLDIESNVILGNQNFASGIYTFEIWFEDLNGISGALPTDTLVKEVRLCNPLAGVYTIGAGLADYSTLIEAVDALSACGVGGPVTFDVTTDTYTGQLIIPQIDGASATNTITFNGNGSTIIHYPISGYQYVVYLKGAKHVTLNNFTIQSSNPDYGWLCRLGHNAEYNVINQCTLDGSLQTNAGYQRCIGVLSTGSETSANNLLEPASTHRHNTISNNFFKGASTHSMYHGISFFNGDTLTVTGNYFQDVAEASISLGFSSGGAHTISGNTIAYKHRINNNYVVGIKLTRSYGGNIVENNKVEFSGTVFTEYTGVYMDNNFADASHPDIIRNNIIYLAGTTDYGTGIKITRSNYTYVLNNTTVAEPDDQGENQLRMINIGGLTNGTTNRIENNLFAINAEGSLPKYFIEANGNWAPNLYGNIDFNNFFSTSNSQNVHLADLDGTDYTTLADWQAAAGSIYDQNSTEFDPNIFFPAGGQFRPSSAAMDNLGTDLLTSGLVPTDFEGTARTTTPDIGALEFTPALLDVGMIEFNAPTISITPGFHNIEVSFKNHGSNTINSADIHWQIDGGPLNTKSFVGTLNSGQVQNNFLVTNHNFSAGLNEIMVWSSDPNGLADEIPVNDTISTTVFVCNPMSGVYTIGGASPDFPDMSSAVAQLVNCGVSGPVVFNVAAGSIFNEKVVITDIPGSSLANTVTFNGNGALIEYFASQGDQEVVYFKGVSHITFDNFIVKTSNPEYYWGLRLGYGAGHNIISNCVFDGTNITDPANYKVAILSTANDVTLRTGIHAETHHNIIEDNTILGQIVNDYSTLSYGIFIRGTSAGMGSPSNIIRRNIINNYRSGGILVSYCEGNQVIAQNEIRNINNYYGPGIGVYDAGPGFLVERNLFTSNNASSYLIIFSRSSGTNADPQVIRNNVIYCNTSRSTRTFYLSENNHTHILNNTVMFDEMGSNDTQFYLWRADSCVILNNLISLNTASNQAVRMYSVSQAVTESNWDYNNFFRNNESTYPIGFASYNGTSYATLAEWKLAEGGAFDQNSVNYNPHFVDVNAENFTPQNGQLNNLGVDLFTTGQVTEDFYGNPRSAAMDIGAIEFDNLSLDIGVTALVSPQDGQASGMAPIEVEIRNFGIQNVTSADLSFQIDGGATATYSWAGNLASGASTTAVIGNYNFSTGMHTIKSWTESPNSSMDDLTYNDTLEQQVLICGVYSGTYTVGGATSDFASFTEVFQALAVCGITGPIILDVQAGATFDERFTIPYIPGSSSINSIYIQGNGANVWPSNRAFKTVITLDSAKYVTIENLNILANEFQSGYMWGFFLTNEAEYITIRACSLLVNTTSLWNSMTEFGAVVISGSETSRTEPTDVSNVTIEDCHFFSPRGSNQYGVSIVGMAENTGSANFIIRNNLIENCTDAGIRIENSTGNHLISNNEIRNTGSNEWDDFTGIYLTRSGTGNVIERNYIHSPWADNFNSLQNSHGINIEYSQGSPGNYNMVRNNIIDFSLFSDRAYAIRLYRSDYVSILNNTIILNDPSGSTHRTGIYANSNAAAGEVLSNCNILNNLLYMNDGNNADKWLMYLIGADHGNYDYNNFFISPESNRAYVGSYTQSHTTLAGWQTEDGGAFDQNSLDLNPDFGGIPKVFNYEPFNPALNGSALDLFTSGEVVDDFYGNPRSASMDIGAVEFEPPTLDLGIHGIQPLTNKSCTQDIVIDIENASPMDVTSAQFSYRVNGGAIIGGNSWNGALSSGQTTSVIAGNSDVGPGYVHLEVFITDVNGLGPDVNPRNDTVVLEFVITNPLPDPPVTSNEIALVGGPIPDLTAVGNNVEWYYDDPPTTLAGVGNTLVTGETTIGVYTYYAVGVDAFGCKSETAPAILTIYDSDVIIWNGMEYINGSGPLNAPDMTDFAKELHILGKGAPLEANAKVSSAVVKMGMDMTIESGNTLIVSEGIENNGLVVIENNASLVQESLNDLNTGTGTYRVKREGMRNAGAFQMWSSPVANARLLNGGVFDGSNACRLMVWNASSQRWKYDYVPNSVFDCGGGNITFSNRFLMFDDPADNIMDVARGYFIPGRQNSPTIVFEGPVFNGTILKPVYETNSITPYTGDDWNLLGNPYPSALSINAWLTANALNLSTEAVYIWDDDGSQGADYDEFDDYATINRLGWVNNGSRDMDGNGKFTDPPAGIASGQGFFIEARTIGNVTFSNSMRLTGENDKFYKSQVDNDPKIWLTITGADGKEHQTLIGFKQDATFQKDKQYDAPILNAQGILSVGTILENTPMAIQGLPPLGENMEYRIPLHLYTKEGGAFEWSTHTNDGFYDIDVFLKTPYQIAEYSLSGNALPVSLEKGLNEGYYLVLRKGNVLNTMAPANDKLRVTVLPEEILIERSSANGASGSIQLIDIKGVVHKQVNSSESLIRIRTNTLASGVYMLQYDCDDHREVIKVVL